MLYLNEKNIRELGLNWDENIANLEETVRLYHAQECAQPIKPYLRYADSTNRIIAMPAYVGGEIQSAGIKWIASFPNNIKIGKPRAHSVVILNQAKTGEPACVINTSLLSGIRTASVSGLMVKHYLKKEQAQMFDVGIIGFGPIGRLHLEMIWYLLRDRISRIYISDLKGVDTTGLNPELREKVNICDSWLPCYEAADIFVTCTVSTTRYINKAPKKNALLLNVSLRDYEPEIMIHTKHLIVDDWDEVCRENTDIEMMHKKYHLKQADTKSLVDVVCHGYLEQIADDDAIYFSPMGMAIFDIATAHHYYDLAYQLGVGTRLDA